MSRTIPPWTPSATRNVGRHQEILDALNSLLSMSPTGDMEIHNSGFGRGLINLRRLFGRNAFLCRTVTPPDIDGVTQDDYTAERYWCERIIIKNRDDDDVTPEGRNIVDDPPVPGTHPDKEGSDKYVTARYLTVTNYAELPGKDKDDDGNDQLGTHLLPVGKLVEVEPFFTRDNPPILRYRMKEEISRRIIVQIREQTADQKFKGFILPVPTDFVDATTDMDGSEFGTVEDDDPQKKPAIILNTPRAGNPDWPTIDPDGSNVWPGTLIGRNARKEDGTGGEYIVAVAGFKGRLCTRPA